ncbi:MAG: Rrf2 family transcriptional regulator [Candidatus Omnitrophica bacterium]|nr:Rrf2 family transcriptional regulator [Candidatus Omnitrophota bacterium]
MKLTTKSAYGVRALINLALMYDKKSPVSINRIAAEEGISKVYLEQILNRLKNAGIVKSIRGPKGGYIFSKDPAGISVYDAVMVLEGSISPGRCTSGKKTNSICKMAGCCPSKEVWDEVARQIEKTLKQFSFKDLSDRAGKIGTKRLKRVNPARKGCPELL